MAIVNQYIVEADHRLWRPALMYDLSLQLSFCSPTETLRRSIDPRDRPAENS
eukprot:COSAG05_NODE_115_length_18028_cov_137.264767_9_plen_52_part_00